jgi:hypothetical protein
MSSLAEVSRQEARIVEHRQNGASKPPEVDAGRHVFQDVEGFWHSRGDFHLY